MHSPSESPSRQCAAPTVPSNPDLDVPLPLGDQDPRLQPPRQLMMRLSTVMRMTGLSRSTIYRLMAARRFPLPVRVGPRAVAWRLNDLERWSEACSASQP